jgi:hypothetical protein
MDPRGRQVAGESGPAFIKLLESLWTAGEQALGIPARHEANHTNRE